MTVDMMSVVPYAQPAALAITGGTAFVFASETQRKWARVGLMAIGALATLAVAAIWFDYIPPCDQLPWWLWVSSGCWMN